MLLACTVGAAVPEFRIEPPALIAFGIGQGKGTEGPALKPVQSCGGISNYYEADVPEALEFFRKLRSAMQANDRKAIAAMSGFPLIVSGKPRIHNKTAFLRHFDRIFDAKVRAAIAEDCVFGNWRGFAIGNGAVWINRVSLGKDQWGEFKLYSVNSQSYR